MFTRRAVDLALGCQPAPQVDLGPCGPLWDSCLLQSPHCRNLIVIRGGVLPPFRRHTIFHRGTGNIRVEDQGLNIRQVVDSFPALLYTAAGLVFQLVNQGNSTSLGSHGELLEMGGLNMSLRRRSRCSEEA